MTLKIGDKVRVRPNAELHREHIGREFTIGTLGLSGKTALVPGTQFHHVHFDWLEKIEPEPPRPLGLQAGDKVVNLKTGREGLVLKGPISGELKVYDEKPPIRDAVPAAALEEYEHWHPGTYDVWRRVTVPATVQAQPW